MEEDQDTDDVGEMMLMAIITTFMVMVMVMTMTHGPGECHDRGHNHDHDAHVSAGADPWSAGNCFDKLSLRLLITTVIVSQQPLLFAF